MGKNTKVDFTGLDNGVHFRARRRAHALQIFLCWLEVI